MKTYELSDKKLKIFLLKKFSELQENTKRQLNKISNFLDMVPKVQATKANINNWDYMKLKSFCMAKETIKKMKR